MRWNKKLEVQTTTLVGGFVSLHGLKYLLREFLRKEYVLRSWIFHFFSKCVLSHGDISGSDS